MVFTKLPFKIVPFDNDHLKKLLQSSNLDLGLNGWSVGPKKYFLAKSYKDIALDIYNFEARTDDVYLTGYVRSGTTMHTEMVWLIGNNLDYEEAQVKRLEDRFPHLDIAVLNSNQIATVRDYSLEVLKNSTGQRFIKAHLPLSLLPPSIFAAGSKVIYCARNPKDVIVSCFHAFQLFSKVDYSDELFPDFFRIFKINGYFFAPFFEHVKEAWAKRNDKNFLFLFYEDTMKDKRQAILNVAQFLNKELTDQEIDGLVNHLSVDKFRKSKAVNLDHKKDAGLINRKEEFIRKGKPGGWRDYFVGDLAREVDDWIADNLKDTDLSFPDV